MAIGTYRVQPTSVILSYFGISYVKKILNNGYGKLCKESGFLKCMIEIIGQIKIQIQRLTGHLRNLGTLNQLISF
ncbi:hypothetical protein L1987_52939 [Smallanthus sonchifolius]|uniref:Uncharacterized protein n=1 Tax=Smallanthus sonchifolius TaxID=185202 RepID=A0ACB9EU75_9ASTR|nr:hypothetical protein L1987_52939 [Smallanthus sonchifolius]